MPDPVNHPAHYTQGGIECIDALEAAMGAEACAAFCRGNAIKYLWRAGKKGDLVEDLRKAIWYLERELRIRGVPRPDADEQLAAAVSALNESGFRYTQGAEKPWRPPVNFAATTLYRLLDQIEKWRGSTAVGSFTPLWSAVDEARKASR